MEQRCDRADGHLRLEADADVDRDEDKEDDQAAVREVVRQRERGGERHGAADPGPGEDHRRLPGWVGVVLADRPEQQARNVGEDRNPDEEVRCALTGGTRRLRCTGRVRLDLRAHVAEVELPQRVLRVVYRRRTRDGRERAPGTDRNGERGATLEVDAQIQSAAEQTAEAGEEHDAGDGRPHAESADDVEVGFAANDVTQSRHQRVPPVGTS